MVKDGEGEFGSINPPCWVDWDGGDPLLKRIMQIGTETVSGTTNLMCPNPFGHQPGTAFCHTVDPTCHMRGTRRTA